MVWLRLKLTIVPIARLFLKGVEGLENVPKKVNFILASNHESYVDPFLILGGMLPYVNKKIHFLAMKGRPFRYLPEDFLKKIFGVITIEKNRKKTFQNMLDFLNNGEIIGIFPGGPRSLDGRMTKGKTGAVRLALAAGVPILPVGLRGTFRIAPREQLIPNLKRAEIFIGKPLYLSIYHNKKITKKLLYQLTTRMMKKIAKLADKEYPFR